MITERDALMTLWTSIYRVDDAEEGTLAFGIDRWRETFRIHGPYRTYRRRDSLQSDLDAHTVLGGVLVVSQKVRQQAEATLAELARAGWNKNSLVKRKDQWRSSPLCLMAAVRMAVGGYPFSPAKGANELIHAIGRRVPDGRLIDDWNDDEETEFEDVQQLLRSIIEDTDD